MGYPVFYVPSGDVLPVPFSTYDGGTGASITLTGLAVTDIEIYKDGSTTQRASDAGYTLLDTDGIDFDGITGIHGFSIDTGDNTDAGFYTVGSWFTVVVSAITVDAQTVNFIACQFRLMAAEDGAGVPDVNVTHFGGTAGTFSGGRPEVNTTHVGGTAQTANDNGADINAILADTGTDGVVVAAASKTGYTLSAAGIQAIWDALTSALTTVGSIGKLLVDNIDAAISSRLSTAGYTAPDNASIATILTRTDVATSTRATPAEVNAEVVDALATDTYAEPGQESPGATVSLATKIGYLFKFLRNKKTQTSTQFSLFADDAATVDQKSTVSDDGTTATRGELTTGP